MTTMVVGGKDVKMQLLNSFDFEGNILAHCAKFGLPVLKDTMQYSPSFIFFVNVLIDTFLRLHRDFKYLLPVLVDDAFDCRQGVFCSSSFIPYIVRLELSVFLMANLEFSDLAIYGINQSVRQSVVPLSFVLSAMRKSSLIPSSPAKIPFIALSSRSTGG